MDRRRILLVVAAIIAALGTLLVVLYVRSADQRAVDQFKAVPVLLVTKQIDPGETVAAAQAAGKIELGNVGEGQKLPGALDSLNPIADQIALTTLYPGEQIISSKFGTTPAATGGLTIPKGKLAISVQLTDTARVAGFVNPGDDVAIFMTSNGTAGLGAFTRLLLPKIEVIAVGSTTVVSTTTTTAGGATTTDNVPRTLFTLAVSQSQAQKVLFAAKNSDLAFGLLDENSVVRPDGGANANNLFK